MGCCFSKKRKTRPVAGSSAFPRRCERENRDPPSPEEETVKEVLSETPSAKPRAEPKPVVGNVAVVVPAADERGVEKAAKKKQDDRDSVDAAVSMSDLGSCVSLSLATDERSEAASESSVATSSVAGPERSPGRRKPAARRRRPVSADLGPARRDRGDRAAAASASSYGVRSRSTRASASPPPPPRPVPRDRSVLRSPSPAAKRAASEPRRAASPTPPVVQQRKPPVPARPSGRVSPRRGHEAGATPPRPASPPSHLEDDAVTAASEPGVPDGNSAGGDAVQGGRGAGGDDGKESLENPLVSLECFIFL